jgi:ribosome-associated protein
MAELGRSAADTDELTDEGARPNDAPEGGAVTAELTVADESEAESAEASVVRIPPTAEVLALGRRIVDVLSDRQAADVVLLDISPMASFADYFVIGTGTSERHLLALRDAVDDALDTDGLQTLQVEGESDSGWILMDYGDVIVHLFDGRTRDYYKLERIWNRASTVLRVL